MSSKVCDEINHAFPNFNGSIGNFKDIVCFKRTCNNSSPEALTFQNIKGMIDYVQTSISRR